MREPDSYLAAMAGIRRGPGHPPHPGIEANARLTGTTGILLVVMLFAEGVTIPFIGPLITWHIAIGLALIPPVALKLGSTLWRFARYYLRDPRYRRAGPPHPALRALGPVVVVTTVAVMASGVAAWLAGPPAHLLVLLHKASFVVWFGAMTIHVLAHALRAGRLAWADRARRRPRRAVPYRRVRQALVVLSLVAGVALGLATRGMVSGWTTWVHAAH
ncbi:MAG: hypothetical protein ACRDZQ_12340 [Acidimicrobiales bacterium]